ncbi:MAG: anaerobic sulfatase-maturation protein [Flavobacteriales bacterium]|nr:anaerobic sulfatase-maturation protein [Flavobacteriales bacterium]
MPETLYPFSDPLYLVAKPASSACNMRCEYCYYLEKEKYYPKERHVMSEQMLEDYIKKFIAAQNTPNVLFNWHGGEAMICGLDFFRQAIAYQKKYGSQYQIVNTIQTNGILLSDEWCEFFKENNFLVGISIDGPQHCHDRYRRTISGQSAFEMTLRGVNLLKKHSVDFNVLCTVNDYNSKYPDEVYSFFKEIGAQYIQFTPVVERIGKDTQLCVDEAPEANVAPWSVSPRDWGEFMCRIFSMWVKKDVGEYFVNFIDSTLSGYVGQDSGNCYFSKKCGHAMALEYNGDVYACDHYVFPQYKIGNIFSDDMRSIANSEQIKRFGEKKTKNLPSECLKCRYINICNGECPKNRINHTGEKGKNINFLCRGYKHFFTTTERYFVYMANELAAGRNVLTVMDKM